MIKTFAELQDAFVKFNEEFTTNSDEAILFQDSQGNVNITFEDRTLYDENDEVVSSVNIKLPATEHQAHKAFEYFWELVDANDL